MKNYKNHSDEAESLKLHASNLRAHISRHNCFEFDMKERLEEIETRVLQAEKTEYSHLIKGDYK